ncbi:DUF7523 family protein [Halobellus ruber]|uniref:Uncharacterized protein n=1 Tax=Halobellus ruber TaxID=2761102 RepID=A0A7J9SJX6_9EURY|nr:hypothetical protein [Halobellus ruber]MBB6645321.1 hypothetical protein [Halobellus ruber]
MSLAAETRAAVRARPWLRYALRAGVVNYAAAAESLDVGGDRDAVATALRRFAGDLPDIDTDAREVTVRMRSGVGLGGADGDAGSGDSDGAAGAGTADADPIASVGGERILPGGGGLTAVTADGDVDAAALSAVVDRLAAENVVVDAAGVAGDRLAVVVPRSDGANALRLVEEALAAVPDG